MHQELNYIKIKCIFEEELHASLELLVTSNYSTGLSVRHVLVNLDSCFFYLKFAVLFLLTIKTKFSKPP